MSGLQPSPGVQPTGPHETAADEDARALRPLAPLDRFEPELLLQAQGVVLAIFDVDGVLTDGRIAIGPEGEAEKLFSTLDGHGLKLLRQAGIEPAVITGRDSPSVRRRLADLGLVHAAFGIADKLKAARALRPAVGVERGLAGPVPWQAVAAMGDDWPDLPLLLRARLALAPPGAHPEVRQAVHHVTAAAAGHGAAREACDLLITATGHYARLLSGHFGGAIGTLDGAGGSKPA